MQRASGFHVDQRGLYPHSLYCVKYKEYSSACIHLYPKVPKIWEEEAAGWLTKTLYLITGHLL